jgi:hypothetical protein
VGKVILPEFVTIDGVSYTSLWCESNGRVPTRVALQVPGSRTSFPSRVALPRDPRCLRRLFRRGRDVSVPVFGACGRRISARTMIGSSTPTEPERFPALTGTRSATRGSMVHDTAGSRSRSIPATDRGRLKGGSSRPSLSRRFR